MKNITKTITLLTTTLLAGCNTTNGWGEKQGENTIIGGVLGGTAGGVVGHQFGKQKEGIIIGTILGGVTGNQIGKGKDIERVKREAEVAEANRRAARIGKHAQHAKQAVASRDHEIEMEESRALELEKQLARERTLWSLRDRQNRALEEIKTIRNLER